MPDLKLDVKPNPEAAEKAKPKTYISQADFYLEYAGRGRAIRAWQPFTLPEGYPHGIGKNWLEIDPNNPPAPPPIELPGVVRTVRR